MSRLRHIAVNAVFLRPRMGGLETYVRGLVPALLGLRPDLRLTLVLHPDGEKQLAAEPWASAVDLVSHPVLRLPATRAISEFTVLGGLVRRLRADVLHSVAMIGPLRPPTTHVLTVADLIWLHHPETAGVTAWLWKLTVPPAARRADRILTFSEASRHDIATHLAVSREKIDVVPPGHGTTEMSRPTSEEDLRDRLALGKGPVLVSFSAKRTHKNLRRLIRALAKVRARIPGAVLVLPGNPTRHEEELKREAASLGLAEAVRFPAYVDEADAEGLYRLAACLVYPSFHEGFGLPVLEAMRRGVPVACSRASSLPEVAGEAARYFDPLQEEEIASALLDVLEDTTLAQRLVVAGRARAALFTWERTAEGTLESYERARSEAGR